MSNAEEVTRIHTGRNRPQFHLHHRIALAMDEAGIKPAEMAAHMRCGTGTISNYRNGHTKPNHSALARWADKCDVEFDWLIGESENGPTGPGENASARKRRILVALPQPIAA